MVQSNSILYGKDEHPDHVVVIKYVPYVGDSKRAMDEYTSEIMMGGHNTLVIHNTCEDSLLASPLILDLAILGELCSRIKVLFIRMFVGFFSFSILKSFIQIKSTFFSSEFRALFQDYLYDFIFHSFCSSRFFLLYIFFSLLLFFRFYNF